MMITIRKTADRSSGFEKVVWDVFFQSRDRGISLEKHFPWIVNSLDCGFYILAEINGDVVGGLVIKSRPELLENQKIKLGIIGLVCVRSDLRGQGISKKILESALSQARVDSFDALTLWTSSPELYERYGFVAADNWKYGWVFNNKNYLKNENDDLDSVEFVDLKGVPVPPFAKSVNQLVWRGCTVFLIKDDIGWIVTEYKGDVRDAANLMVNKLSGRWRLNIEENDSLLYELKRIGCEMEINPVNLQMWQIILPELSIPELVDNIKISVLERI